MGGFYDRKQELDALERCWQAEGAQLALLYGRRRLGKTYLLQHFLRGKPHAYFLAAQTALGENLSQLAEAVLSACPGSGYTAADLGTLNAILRFVSSSADGERFALVIDEFQYLLEQDRSLPSQLQAWWDTDGIRSGIFLVLCGSHIGTMAGLGGSQAPLFGRFTFRYQLPPMTYADVARFYEPSGYSLRDRLAAYGVMGGTPRYHALSDPARSLKENTCSQILDPLGLLHNEPEVLLLSSQVRDPAPYNAALRAIATGSTKFNEISQRVGASSSQLAFYLKGLTELEWIAREYPFDETSDRRAVYRIADGFLGFWYRFVAGLRSALEFRDVQQVYESSIEPYFDEYMGRLVFESICQQYLRAHGHDRLGVSILRAGRYWSRDGQIEIDIMAELDDARYLFGECKWSSAPIGFGVYYGLREKVSRLPHARHRSNPRYVLFSVAGFDDDLKRLAKREGILLVAGEELLD